MKDTDVRQGTLALMVLKTLDVLGPLHGYGIARRIEQISGDLLTVNQGTLYPVLLKLEQEGRLPPNGERRTTTAKHASTRSRAKGASNCRPKPADGNRPRRSSNDFSLQRFRT
jgi:PadR family transcriptional regulator